MDFVYKTSWNDATEIVYYLNSKNQDRVSRTHKIKSQNEFSADYATS